jgi:hypothetical protein
MAVRVVANPDGSTTMSDPSAPNIAEKSPESPVGQVRVNQPRVRVSVDTETGATRIEESRATEYRARPVSQQGVTVRTATGPTTLAQAGPDSVVNIPGLGETNAAALVTMGFLTPRPGGVGFDLVKQEAPSDTPADQKPADREEDAPNPADLAGVPPTSSASDAVVARLQENTPQALEGILTSIAQGIAPDKIIEDVGRQLGDENFADSFAGVHREYIASGQKALSNVGVANHEDFERWARENYPEQSADAVRDLVLNRSVTRLTSLGRQYVSQANTKLATLIRAKGVDTLIDNGSVYVSAASLGIRTRGDFGKWISVSDAVRAGHISLG